jgi:hypothetical protein
MAIFILDAVIGAIAEKGLESVWDTAKRREAILHILKKMGFSPNALPRDFDGLYAYTLIEYGIGKPRQVLDLFRYDIVKEAFRRSFEQRNRAAFDREMQAFIDSDIGREAYQLDYNPQQELARFQAVFDELAERARTVSEVRQDHKLEDIHQVVQQVLGSLEELSASQSDARDITSNRVPQLTLKIFRHRDRRYRDEIRFLQPYDSSPFRFGLALVNTTESTVAKEIDITISIFLHDCVVPQELPIFEVPTDKGWEYHHDRIQYRDETVLRFHGSERDRCPSGQPLEWNFSLILKERVIGEFLLDYRVSSIPQEKESAGKLKIHMG